MIKPLKNNASLMLHLQTAKNLIDGIMESVDEESNFNNYYGCPPEHSHESVKRRCVQARQELLRVYQEANNWTIGR